MPAEETLIPYDRMKAQFDRELSSHTMSIPSGEMADVPRVSFEKGSTLISFKIPQLNETTLYGCTVVIKKHIENIRISTYGDGHYAFQALNRNMFKTENMLENIKFEFFSLINSRVEISKKGNLTQEELNTAIEIYKNCYSGHGENPVLKLKKLGASLISPENGPGWDYIAGYEEVKRNIRESIILPLKNPDIYDAIARMTRKTFESNRPRAILFEGPPGVGKTTIARLIAGEVNIPLVYVPIESIMSKWFGQSSQNLAAIFESCEEMGGAILFLDEIDSLAGSRDQNMFEATRRILSVLLRKLDGIDAATNSITIGATNRKNDLDHALISRFDQSIRFPLPNARERSSIFANYASQLSPEETTVLGEAADGMSGRNIKDFCEYAERRWARKVLIKKLEVTAPSLEYYSRAMKVWLEQSAD